MTKILDDILKLNVSERIVLVEAIWNSIAESDEPVDLSEETRQLLDNRLKDHHLNPQQGSSWNVVKDRIKNDSNA